MANIQDLPNIIIIQNLCSILVIEGPVDGKYTGPGSILVIERPSTRSALK